MGEPLRSATHFGPFSQEKEELLRVRDYEKYTATHRVPGVGHAESEISPRSSLTLPRDPKEAWQSP
jgi:hypothetical protein